MAQVWYVGILGRLIGNPIYGGDIGFELSGAFSAMCVPPSRYPPTVLPLIFLLLLLLSSPSFIAFTPVFATSS
jgi:hypothetical protein